MDLFKKLDDFCNSCEEIQDKTVEIRSCFVENIGDNVRSTKDLIVACDRISADYNNLQSQLNKLRSEFFSDEITEIKQKFETVEHLYFKVDRQLKSQLNYLTLYRTIYDTCVNARSSLNGPAFKNLQNISEFERKGVRRSLEDLYLRVVTEQFSLAELNDMNSQVDVKIYGDTELSHLHNLDNFVHETLLNIRNVWNELSDGSITLESVIEVRKKLAEKEKALKAAIAALKLRYDQARIPVNETNLRTALNDLLDNLQDVLRELREHINAYESFLTEMSLSMTNWPNAELQKNSNSLEQSLQRRIATLSSNLDRYTSYLNTMEKIRHAVDKADMVGSNPGAKVEEAESLLNELKGLDADFRLIKRESLMLQEVLRESPTLAKQMNFFDEIERLDRQWRKAKTDLDDLYVKLLSEQIDIPGLDQKLQLCQDSLTAEQQVFERYKNLPTSTADFISKLGDIQNRNASTLKQLEEIGKLLELLRGVDLKDTRIRYINCRNNLGKLEEGILELKTCLERLHKFELWLKEYKGSVNAVSRITHSPSQTQEVYNNLKWQLDLGLTRELTLQQIGDKKVDYPVVGVFLTPVTDDYYKIINKLKEDLKRLEAAVNLHKRFKTLYDQCDRQLTALEIDIRSVEFLLEHQMNVGKDRLDLLLDTLSKLKSMEPKITEAFHIAQELQNEETDSDGNLQISQALDLKERCKQLMEKNIQIRNDLDKTSELDVANAKKLDSFETWLNKLKLNFENSMKIADKTRLLVELKLMLAEMNRKNVEYNEINSMISTSKSHLLRARCESLRFQFNSQHTEIQNEIDKITSHTDKMKSYKELREKLGKTLRELDTLLGPLERELKRGSQPIGDLKVLSGKLRDAKNDLSKLSDIHKSVANSLTSEASENQQNDLKYLQKEIESVESRLNDSEKLAKELEEKRRISELQKPISKLPIPIPVEKKKPVEPQKLFPIDEGIGKLPIYHPTRPNANLRKDNEANLVKLPELKPTIKEPQISTEDRAIQRRLKELEDFTVNFKRILTDASGFKCQLENLPGKLQLLKALEAQRPQGDDYVKQLEMEFNSTRKFDPELKRRFGTLKYDWLAANGKLSSAKLNLKILMDDGDAIKSVLKRVEDGLSGVAQTIRSPPLCTCLNDKIAHRDSLKNLTNTLKNLKVDADSTDESASNLTSSGIQSPLLHNDIKLRIKNLNRDLEREIGSWSEAADHHSTYLSTLKKADETLDGMGPILAAFNLKTPENVATTNAWLLELDNLKSTGCDAVENTEYLMPGATKFLSNSAADKVKRHQRDTTSYWQDFLLPMIEATEHRLQWQLTHPGTPKPTRSGESTLDRSQVRPRRDSLERLEHIGGEQEFVEVPTKSDNGVKKSESGYATGHHTPVAPNIPENLPEEVVIRNYENEPKGRGTPKSYFETSFGVNLPARRSDSWTRVDLIGDNQSDHKSISLNIDPWEGESLRSKSALSEAQNYLPPRHSRGSLKRSDSWEKLDLIENVNPPQPEYEREVPQRNEQPEEQQQFVQPQQPTKQQEEPLRGLETEATTTTNYWDAVEFAGWQYEDKFVKLTPDWLMVKSNLFPFRQPQILYPADLDEIFFFRDFPDGQKASKPRRSRGLFWAADCCYSPQAKSANIAVRSDKLALNTTFAVRDVDKFLSVLKPMLNDSCAILCQE